MSNMKENRKYQDFGGHLKKIRLQAKKSIADVSGAVELSSEQLKQIESGFLRPHKTLIPLLASYFKLNKSETQHLLTLAGYRKQSSANNPKSELQAIFEGLIGNKMPFAQQVLLAFSENTSTEERILYTNETSINIAPNGVVIEFFQNAAVNRDRQSKSVARVGMSLEHALRLKTTLQQALEDFESKRKQSRLDF